MAAIVKERVVLHHNQGRDAIYIVEVLEEAGIVLTFTLWGRRGANLTPKEVPQAKAFLTAAKKRAEGYRDKTDTIGLTADERNMRLPLTPDWAIAAAVPANTPPPKAGPKPAATTPAPAPPVATPFAPGPLPEAQPLDSIGLRGEVERLRPGNFPAVHSRVQEIPPSNIQPTAQAGIFSVRSVNSSNSYSVRLNPPACNCQAAERSGDCKHQIRVAELHGEAAVRALEAVESKERLQRQVAALKGQASQVAAAGTPAPVIPTHLHREFSRFNRPGPSHPLVPTKRAHSWDARHARKFAYAFEANRGVLLVGPSGTGKSTMTEDFHASTNRGMLRINVSGQTGLSDLIGHYVIAGGGMKWVDGALPRAMREGLGLLIDELDMGDPALLALLHPVLEPGGALVIKEHDGEVLRPHADFRIYATANSLGLHDDYGQYHGTQAMNCAMLNRFIVIQVENPRQDAEAGILVQRGIDSLVAELVARVSVLIRGLIAQDKVMGVWGTRSAIDFAEAFLKEKDWEFAFEIAAEGKFSRDEYRILWEAVQREVGN